MKSKRQENIATIYLSFLQIEWQGMPILILK